MVSYCELCDCQVPNSPAEHKMGRRHRQNVAAGGTTNPVTQWSSPPPSNPHSQPISPPRISPPAISVPAAITSDARATVSHESGLDFEVEGNEISGHPSFPSTDIAIRIEKTEMQSSLTITAVKPFPAPGTPESWCDHLITRFEILMYFLTASKRLYLGRWFGGISHAESSCHFSRHVLAHSACPYGSPSSSSILLGQRPLKSSLCPASYVGVLPSQVTVLTEHNPGSPFLEVTK
jgi:hypothetical protein